MKKSILVSSAALFVAILATLMYPIAAYDDPIPHFHHPDYTGVVGWSGPDLANECTHLIGLVGTEYDTWTGVGVALYYWPYPPPYSYYGVWAPFERGYGGEYPAIGPMHCDWILDGTADGYDAPQNFVYKEQPYPGYYQDWSKSGYCIAVNTFWMTGSHFFDAPYTYWYLDSSVTVNAEP
jgi:hypothetical protein